MRGSGASLIKIVAYRTLSITDLNSFTGGGLHRCEAGGGLAHVLQCNRRPDTAASLCECVSAGACCRTLVRCELSLPWYEYSTLMFRTAIYPQFRFLQRAGYKVLGMASTCVLYTRTRRERRAASRSDRYSSRKNRTTW